MEEADDHDLLGVSGECGAEREDAPYQACCWEPDARSDFLEDQIVWDLPEQVASVEHTEDGQNGVITLEHEFTAELLTC